MSFSPSILLRSTLAFVRMAAGIYRSRLKTHAEKKQSVILMYHRVIDPANTDEYIEPGMYVNPLTFAMHLELLPEYFTVVSLQDIISSFNKIADKPLCAITFDDGWRDFYEHAYPILKSRNLPATNFLATDYVGTKNWFWTDRLANILKKISTIPFSSGEKKSDDISSKIEQLPGSLFSRIDSAIKMLKPLSKKQIQEILDEIEKRNNVGQADKNRAFLNWDECRELKTSGLITFGSHTAQHIILTAEAEDVCRDDLKVSRSKLIEENVVDQSFIPFCYPNGGFSQKTACLVKDAHYHCAVTTNKGWISEATDRFAIDRIGMHQDVTSNKPLSLARIL